MTAQISVIIPYYQHDKNILRRALQSVIRQKNISRLEIIVIDDESPVAPEPERITPLPDHISLKILKQKNSGPGAARNLGLSAVSAESSFVSFLDSDDEWTPTHLSNALAGMGDDLDFYFSNHVEPDAIYDMFTTTGRPDLLQHTKLERAHNCYKFSSSMVRQIITNNVIETSTVVFKWAPFLDLRFPDSFRNAYEDHLFWLSIAERSQGICFSSDVECQYGKGVNIYRSTSLGSPRFMARLLDQIRFRNAIKTHASDLHLQTVLDRHTREARHGLVAETLYRLKRGLPINWNLLILAVKHDPGFVVSFVPIAIKIACQRPAVQTQAN